MEKAYIGIDPGVNGGIAVIWEDGSVSTHKMPETYPDIYELIRTGLNLDEVFKVAILEDVGQGIPGQSSKATATFARHCGHLEMALYACGIRTEKVKPQKWQKYYSNTLGKSSECEKREWKNRLKGEAQRLFPDAGVTLWNADALLMAEYGRRNKL